MVQRGQTLVEMLGMVLLIGLSAAIAIPQLGSAQRGAALRRATENVRSQLWRARAEAVNTGMATALVFDCLPGGGWRCYVCRDGDGDGVRRADLAAGRDLVVGRVLELEVGAAGFGILQGIRIPDPGGSGSLGGNMDDPVRAGSGNILTFTAQGTSSSGSIYLTDRKSSMRAIRIFGVTGRMRTLAWSVGWDRWRIAR